MGKENLGPQTSTLIRFVLFLIESLFVLGPSNHHHLYPQWSDVCPLTCNDPGGEEELADGLGKRTGGHSEPTQDTAQHDGPPAAQPLHQHAAEGTCGADGSSSEG